MASALDFPYSPHDCRSSLKRTILSSFCVFLLRIVKEADVAVSCIDPSKVTRENIIRVKPISMESCRNLQCYDACNVYADVGALPPCICNVSEGL
ncbi:Protein FAM24A [Lemmus lemmus]